MVIVIFILCAMLLFVIFGRPAESPSTSVNNLRGIALATCTRLATRDRVPQGAILLEDGRLGHGWILPLLPNLDQVALYDQIDKTKPWADPVNREAYSRNLPFLAYFPYRTADTEKTDSNGFPVTTYSANEHVFLIGQYLTSDDITDGRSNTIFFGEIKENYPAWGSPPNVRDPGLGLQSPKGFGGNRTSDLVTVFAFGDASVRSISNTVDPQILKALATPGGGEKIDHSLY